MFGSIRLVMVEFVNNCLSHANVYVMKLRSDNAILKPNQVKLEEAVKILKRFDC